jgi:YidC/Oxa1 family membrane protein insertase
VFTTIIVRPIFNLLVAIYALLPGHNFGLAIIIFTIVVRLALWPLLKKQLHQAKIMRKLQPELKEIKKAAKGDRQKEALMMQELYKERGINPFGSIGIVLLQLPILIGLYSGLRRSPSPTRSCATWPGCSSCSTILANLTIPSLVSLT